MRTIFALGMLVASTAPKPEDAQQIIDYLAENYGKK